MALDENVWKFDVYRILQTFGLPLFFHFFFYL